MKQLIFLWDVPAGDILKANSWDLEYELLGYVNVIAAEPAGRDTRTVSRYTTEIHHYFTDGNDFGYDFELCEISDDPRSVGNPWLALLKGIKTATHFKRFQTRAENLIAGYLAKKLGWKEYRIERS